MHLLWTSTLILMWLTQITSAAVGQEISDSAARKHMLRSEISHIIVTPAVTATITATPALPTVTRTNTPSILNAFNAPKSTQGVYQSISNEPDTKIVDIVAPALQTTITDISTSTIVTSETTTATSTETHTSTYACSSGVIQNPGLEGPGYFPWGVSCPPFECDGAYPTGTQNAIDGNNPHSGAYALDLWNPTAEEYPTIVFYLNQNVTLCAGSYNLTFWAAVNQYCQVQYECCKLVMIVNGQEMTFDTGSTFVVVQSSYQQFNAHIGSFDSLTVLQLGVADMYGCVADNLFLDDFALISA